MLVPMNEKYAREISNWKYTGQYNLYSFSNNEETIEELMNGTYYVYLTMNKSEIIGYFCIGESARIPTLEEYIYDEEYLDIGLGMRPDLCGKGLGYNFLLSGLEFLGEKYNKKKFRITVLSKNIRAIKLYIKIGFEEINTVRHRKTIDKFLIMEYNLEDN